MITASPVPPLRPLVMEEQARSDARPPEAVCIYLRLFTGPPALASDNDFL